MSDIFSHARINELLTLCSSANRLMVDPMTHLPFRHVYMVLKLPLFFNMQVIKDLKYETDSQQQLLPPQDKKKNNV